MFQAALQRLSPEGCILHRRDGGAQVFTPRLCGIEDYAQVMALQLAVHDAMPDPSLFALTGEQELKEELAEDFVTGLYAGDTLAGCGILVRNRLTPYNDGHYLDYDDAACLRCATFSAGFVDPAYRGYGIQPFLLALHTQLARATGAFEGLTTVSERNPHSLNNVLQSGFTVVAHKTLYGGKERLLLRKLL